MAMKDPKKPFGRHVRKLRTDLEWSQEQLAFEAGLDRTYIGGVERGERNIALVNTCRIAKALGVTPAELMAFD